LRTITVVTQASGAGKTKLPFDATLAEDSKLVAIVITACSPDNTGPSMAFEWLAKYFSMFTAKEHEFVASSVDLTKGSSGQASPTTCSEKLDEKDDVWRAYRDFRALLVNVVLLAHVEWVVLVLEKVHELNSTILGEIDKVDACTKARCIATLLASSRFNEKGFL